MLFFVDCQILITSSKLHILILYFHFVLVKTLSDTQYLKRIKRACKCLKLLSKKKLHFGRVTASSLMDMVEVKPDVSRAVGNWKNDTYDNHYSFKLPLSGMRVMAGFDARRGYHSNQRLTIDD